MMFYSWIHDLLEISNNYLYINPLTRQIIQSYGNSLDDPIFMKKYLIPSFRYMGLR